MELAIDTSTRYASIALTRDGTLLWELSWRSEQNHTMELAPAVQAVLGHARASPRDLRAIVVAGGPGGFSALRVGLGFAKGVATALGIPLVGIGTLEVEAIPYLQRGLPVCPLLDAGRKEVAWALFQKREDGWEKVVEESISPLEEVVARVPQEALFCGEAASRLAAWSREHSATLPHVIVTPLPTRRASTLAYLGHLRLARGEKDDPVTLQPLYLRRPSITMPKGTP